MQCQLQARAIEFLLGVPIRTLQESNPSEPEGQFGFGHPVSARQALSLDRSAGKANHQQRDCVRV